MEVIYKYSLKRKLSELLSKGRVLTVNFNCGENEASIDLFIDGKYSDLGFYLLNYSLSSSIIQDLNLSFEGFHYIEGSGFFELINNDLYLEYNLEEIDWNPVNYENLIIDKEEYIKEHMIYLKGKILFLSSKFDDEDSFNNELLSLTKIQQEILDAQNYLEPTNHERPTEEELWNRLIGNNDIKIETINQSKPSIKSKREWWKFW